MRARYAGLRMRFLLACGLLVGTSAIASVWTLTALARLSFVVGQTVEGIDDAADATSQLSGALEREDDALLLALVDSARGRRSLAEKRALVDDATAKVLSLHGDLPLPPAAARLRDGIGAYRRAADRIAEERRSPDRFLRYHRDANPLLRSAVAQVTAIREQFFKEAQRVPTVARGEVVRARGIVLVISCLAFAVSIGTALHLVRSVVDPLSRITSGVVAIRDGRFDERIRVDSRDELGDLAFAYNEMAARLAEFRRLNLDEVLRAKAVLEATLRALPDAVVLLDHDANVVSLNAAAESLLVTTDKRPKKAEDIVIEGFNPDIILQYLESLGTHAAAADLSQALRIERDGKSIRLLPRLLPMPGLAGGHPGAILVLYDVTELAQLDERRVDLVAVASHELQTPLTTLRMTLLMLHEDATALSPRQSQLLETALVGIEQLADTVSEYLDLTRIEAGQLRLHWDRVDPVALATKAVERARAATGVSGARITLSCEGKVEPLWADSSRLRLVLDNLLSNAVKYTPSGGWIDVTVQPSAAAAGDGLRISVRDEGPGVPAEFRSKIFEKFFRVEHQRPDGDRGLRGSGIGLHLAREIVERHGGHIECRSLPETSGACMIIELPRDGRPTA